MEEITINEKEKMSLKIVPDMYVLCSSSSKVGSVSPSYTIYPHPNSPPQNPLSLFPHFPPPSFLSPTIITFNPKSLDTLVVGTK